MHMHLHMHLQLVYYTLVVRSFVGVTTGNEWFILGGCTRDRSGCDVLTNISVFTSLRSIDLVDVAELLVHGNWLCAVFVELLARVFESPGRVFAAGCVAERPVRVFSRCFRVVLVGLADDVVEPPVVLCLVRVLAVDVDDLAIDIHLFIL